MSKVANAILVKSRAKFGKSLTDADYERLLNCASISEIVSYLKKTHYSETLEGVKEAAIHRGNLETLLKKKIYRDFSDLCRFERSIGEHYFEYLTIKNEIDRFLNFLRYFIAGIPEKYVVFSGDFFIRLSKIDFIGITAAKNYDDILNCLAHTPYRKLLAPFRPTQNGNLDFTTIEAVLDKYCYGCGISIADKYFSGSEARQLKEIIGFCGEIDDIRRIYRIKKYYDISEDMQLALLTGRKGYLSSACMRRLISCENGDAVLDILKNTRYGKIISNGDYSYIDELTNKVMYHYCIRKMRMSSNAAVVMASAIKLFEIEVENLTNIIEGKRYGVDASVIRPLIYIDGKDGD